MTNEDESLGEEIVKRRDGDARRVPLYYLIVYRPEGSNTWTPASKPMLSMNPAGNFFASEHRARDYVNTYLKGHLVYLPGPNRNEAAEFAIAEVRYLPPVILEPKEDLH